MSSPDSISIMFRPISPSPPNGISRTAGSAGMSIGTGSRRYGMLTAVQPGYHPGPMRPKTARPVLLCLAGPSCIVPPPCAPMRGEPRGGCPMSDAKNSGRPKNPVSRRAFLRTAGMAGGAAALGPAVLRGRAEAQETPSPVRPDPAAKRGGTLRYAVHNAPAHFDVHQSGTVANIGPQSPMYDTLLRRSPKDGQTIIPDLAWKYDISPDGKRYTFHLRKGVKFHDGADFTAEDVKATYDRIAHPPKGVVIPRTPLFATVGDIVVLDPHKIEFRLTEARPKSYMLGAFASGWNIIVRKKTLDDNQGNLRQVMNYPGTGPFRHVQRKDKEIWIQERKPDYWNKGLPLVDKLEIYNLPPFSPALGSSF